MNYYSMANEKVCRENAYKLEAEKKRKIAWGLIVLCLCTLGIGLGALWLVGTYSELSIYQDVFYKQLIYVAVGIIGCALFTRVRSRYFHKLSGIIYILSVGLLLYGKWLQIYGDMGATRIHQLSVIGIGIVPICLPLLLLCYSSFLYKGKPQKCQEVIGLLLIGVVPILLIANQGMMTAILYLISVAGITTLYVCSPFFEGSRKAILGLMYGGGVSVGIGVLMVMMHNQGDMIMMRLNGFYRPETDPTGAGYQPLLLQKIREHAALVGGQGFENVSLSELPSPIHEKMLSFILGSMGWVAFGAVIVCVLGLLMKMIMMTKKVEAWEKKLLGSAIILWIGTQSLVNILMNTGILPLTEVDLPFISYSGAGMTINMLLLGLFMGVCSKVKE